MADNVDEYYANDIVYRFDKKRRVLFGVVTESCEGDIYDTLEKGQIKVWWNNASDEIIWKQDKVHLFNRAITPGVIVRKLVDGKTSKRGYCKEAKQYVTVQIIGTDKIIERVNFERLKSVCKLNCDLFVFYNNKYGFIKNVTNKLVLQSKCGSVAETIVSHLSDIDDFWLSKRNRLYTVGFYPGQEVVCTPQYLSNITWLKKSKTMKKRMGLKQRFTIQSAEVVQLSVIWFDSTCLELLDKEIIIGEDIKKLQVLDPQPYNVNPTDRLKLKISSSDVLVKKSEFIRKLSQRFKPETPLASRHSLSISKSLRSKQSPCNLMAYDRRPSVCRWKYSPTMSTVQIKQNEDSDWTTDEEVLSDEGSSCSSGASRKVKTNRSWPPKLRELIPGNTLPVEVLFYESKVTVVWQDGTMEEDIPSTQLHFSLSLDNHELFPGEWVVSDSGNFNDKYGVVQSVDVERTAKVKWFRDYKPDENETEPVYICTTELSVYDLKKHCDYLYRPGSPVRPANDECKMGHVIDSYPEGFVQVKWHDGQVTKCWPQDLLVMLELSEISDMSSTFSGSERDTSWETESVESVHDCACLVNERKQRMAAKVNYLRSRLHVVKDMLKMHSDPDSLILVRDLLTIYDNLSFIDKYLGTTFFCKKSYHFKTLLKVTKERALQQGIELGGRLFSSETTTTVRKPSSNNVDGCVAAMKDIESRIMRAKESQENTPAETPENSEVARDLITNESICLEIVLMLITRMDLAYAELVARGTDENEAVLAMTKASERSTPAATAPTTPDVGSVEVLALTSVAENGGDQSTSEGFTILEEAPKTHNFYENKFEPIDAKTFYKVIQKEAKLLKDSLPKGVWVRSYADRLDLMSVMIRGPSKTPYEDGLFLFDLQLSPDYPKSPPSCHFISYSSERLNPNLYVEGKVCISLLGTWIGKKSESWGPSSTLLQLIVSIQGLILVSEPYYNEAGYEAQMDSQQGWENSRTYNEHVILKLVQAMTELILSPPDVFRKEIMMHFVQNAGKFCERIEQWTRPENPVKPEFSLLPVSKGFLISLHNYLSAFKDISRAMIESYVGNAGSEN